MNNFLTPFSRSQRRIQMRWRYSRKKLQYGSCLSTLIVGTFFSLFLQISSEMFFFSSKYLQKLSVAFDYIGGKIFCKCFGQTYFLGKCDPRVLLPDSKLFMWSQKPYMKVRSWVKI